MQFETKYLTRLVLIAAVMFFAVDIIGDIQEGEGVLHWLLEASISILILLSLYWEISQSRKLKEQLSEYEIELNSLKGKLAEVVKEQFQQWSLSKSESEIAWLIIKGFSFQEISQMRSVNEKTVRQQAVAIYRKSDTSNRSEFTAGFLDDLLNA